MKSDHCHLLGHVKENRFSTDFARIWQRAPVSSNFPWSDPVSPLEVSRSGFHAASDCFDIIRTRAGPTGDFLAGTTHKSRRKAEASEKSHARNPVSIYIGSRGRHVSSGAGGGIYT